MANIKTQELTGAGLDWAVAKALGCELTSYHDHFRGVAKLSWDEEKIAAHLAKVDDSQMIVNPFSGNAEPIPNYSASWSAAGPIIESAGVATRKHTESGNWYAMLSADAGNGQTMHWSELTARGGERYGPYSYQVRKRKQRFDGPTALIAAMRCYVASKLGPEVDLPAALVPV